MPFTTDTRHQMPQISHFSEMTEERSALLQSRTHSSRLIPQELILYQLALELA